MPKPPSSSGRRAAPTKAPARRNPSPDRPDRPGGKPRSDGPAEAPDRTERAPDLAFVARGVPILHEDADVLVLHKPIGLITADPNAGHDDGPRPLKTLFDMVKQYATAKAKKRRGSPPAAYIIHRLDKDASGVIVFAKSPEAFGRLKDDLKHKRIEREYLAVAEGVVAPVGSIGRIDYALRLDPTDREAGPERPAITHYKVLAVGAGRTLLIVRLETGRKNQVRAHFSMKGFPLIGDGRFGAGSNPIGRLGLHAWRLSFDHPKTGRHVSFESAPPASFHRAVGLSRLPKEPAASTPESRESAPPPNTHTRGAATPPRSTTTTQASHGSQSSPQARPDRTADRTPGAEDTSWEPVAGWYDTLHDDAGSDHYRGTILPGALRLLACDSSERVLDVACGQGVLCRRLAERGITSIGLDASRSLIELAQSRSKLPDQAAPTNPTPPTPPTFAVCDARSLEDASLEPATFDAVACVMALSNIDPIEPVLAGVARLLRPGGRFVLVITHPAFRAIGRTGWGWDEEHRSQYRRIEAYLSPSRSDVRMHPGKAARKQPGGELTTTTFHRPLQDYVIALGQCGLLIDALEEWPSARASDSGPRAAEENRARLEIPMFLGLRAVRVHS